MGCNRGFLIVSVTWLLLHSLVLGSSAIYDPDALELSLHDYAMAAQATQRTGTLSKVPLPSNYSGIKVSVVRLRSGNLYEKGANVSSFYVPPRVIPFPFVRRVVLMYENLGNWSSHYYHIPGYSLVAPVVGLTAYDASNLTGSSHEKVRFNVVEYPILVTFPDIEEHGDSEVRCVKLGDDGMIQFRNMSDENICITQGDGHFSVVVPVPESDKKRNWKLWGTLIGVGFFGLVLVVMIVHSTYKLVMSKRIKEMEGASDNGVSIDTMWVGRSKMPSASMSRTQPELENEYAP